MNNFNLSDITVYSMDVIIRNELNFLSAVNIKYFIDGAIFICDFGIILILYEYWVFAVKFWSGMITI